jgi:hypothetical protein
MLEIALWWFRGDLSKPEVERTMSGMSIGPLARLVRDEAKTKLTEQGDIDGFSEIVERIENAKPERDLAVHGAVLKAARGSAPSRYVEAT